MRTNEARARLIHRRTAEIKQERRIKRQRRLDAVCMAVCLLLVIGIGALMPGLMRNTADGGIVHPSGTASLLGSHAALGYIIMGLLAFLLGVCVTVLLYRLLSFVTPLINIFSIFATSLTMVPGIGLSDERTSSSTEYFFAISTERLLSTCAPKVASSSISS